MAKSLLQLSMTLKNTTIFPKYFSTVRMCYGRNELAEVKGESQGKIRAASVRELFDVLQKDINPSTLLSNIEENKSFVDGRHVVTALTSMHKYYKENSVPPEEIQNSVHFQTICSTLNRHLRTLGTPQILQAIKIFNLVGVPASTTIMQSLLQLLRKSINDLNLSDIFFLSFLLKKLENNHLSDALKIALPKVFKAQYKLQLDTDNVRELTKALRFASEYMQDTQVITYIVNAIDDYPGPIDIDSAVYTFWSLSEVQSLSNRYSRVLHKVTKVIADNVDIMNLFEVTNILAQIVKGSCRSPDFYKPVLIDKLVEKMISTDCAFDKTIRTLNNLNKLRHVNLRLLDYLSTQCCKNPKILSECHALSLMTLSVGFAQANYKPKKWNALAKLLVKNHERLLLNIENLCYYAVNLVSLDLFDSSIFANIFRQGRNHELFKNTLGNKLKKLYISVKYLCPEYSGPWPSDVVIQSFKCASITEYRKPDDYPLLPALENLLKNPSYIKTDLTTEEGIYIDHLIVLQDRRPVEFNFIESGDSNATINIEDLNIPKELTRVAVLLLPPEVYGKNVQILQAPVSLNIKLLEALSYEVVAVSQEVWNRMPENELVPYLKSLLCIETEASQAKVCDR